MICTPCPRTRMLFDVVLSAFVSLFVVLCDGVNIFQPRASGAVARLFLPLSLARAAPAHVCVRTAAAAARIDVLMLS